MQAMKITNKTGKNTVKQRKNILHSDDHTLLATSLLEEVHRDFYVPKAKRPIGHGVIASRFDDWRTKANARPLKLVRTNSGNHMSISCR